MGKARPDGRSKTDAKHVRLYATMTRSPAYRSLSCYARALLVELGMIHNSMNNGQLSMSYRQAAALLNVDKNTAMKAFRELEDRGFIRPNAKGLFTRQMRVATTWILTEWPHGGKLATRDFAKWTPPENQKAVLSRQTACLKSSDREGASVGGIKPICRTNSDRTPPIAPGRCLPISDITSLPNPAGSERALPAASECNKIMGGAAETGSSRHAAREAVPNEKLQPPDRPPNRQKAAANRRLMQALKDPLSEKVPAALRKIQKQNRSAGDGDRSAEELVRPLRYIGAMRDDPVGADADALADEIERSIA